MGTAGPSAPREQRHRPLLGLCVGIAVAGVVVYPAFMTWLLALISFSGCFIGPCIEPDPDPWTGALYGAVSVILAALPFTVGVATAGLGLRMTAAVALLAAAIATAWIAASVLLP